MYSSKVETARLNRILNKKEKPKRKKKTEAQLFVKKTDKKKKGK
tara:strand:- start:654 stop:785 length:132 start_codon:yes stop_codon:yes gene_type:complete